jgi:hypothetical protein
MTSTAKPRFPVCPTTRSLSAPIGVRLAGRRGFAVEVPDERLHF